MPPQQLHVAGRPPSGVQGDQIKRRGICCAVVWRVRDQLEVSEFAIANFVQDFAGLRIAIVVLNLGLERAQDIEAAAREIRIDQNVLQRDNQAVPSERSNKPRHARGRQKNLVVGVADREPQCRHVLQCLTIKAVELLIAGADFEHGP